MAGKSISITKITTDVVKVIVPLVLTIINYKGWYGANTLGKND